MVATKEQTEQMLVIEIDEPTNANLHFSPLGKSIRGKFSAQRAAEHDSGAVGLFGQFPEPIPGQRLALDMENGTGKIIEPLHEPQHAALREKLAKRGQIDPAEQVIPSVHVPTWLFWMKQAVLAGIARVVQGELPVTIPGTPRKNFITTPAEDPTERLARAMEDQNKLLLKLLERK